MKKIWFSSAILSMLLLVSSCKKGNDIALQSAEDNAQMETEFAYIYEVAADLISTNPKTRKTENNILIGDAGVTLTDTTFDDGDGIDMLIDYGPLNNGSGKKGLQCKDGRYRAGKVHVGLNQRWSVIPDTLIIAISSGNEYYVGNGTDMYKLSGNMQLIRTGELTYKVVVNDATLRRSNGAAYMNYEHSLTVTEEVGEGWLNDTYQVTGSGSGANVNGEPFEVEITTPLVRHVTYAGNCLSTFVTGQQKLTSDGNEYTVDYNASGDKVCDSKVTVTFKGDSKDFNLF